MKTKDPVIFGNRSLRAVEYTIRMTDDRFQWIKRAADVIAKSGNVTYDRKNNVPDFFLEDVLNISGWETTSVNPLQW